MGTCTLTVDQTKILNHKSDSRHADNDWISLVVAVNDKVILWETAPLRNPKFAGQSQLNIFGDGDVAYPWGFTLPCKNADTVIAYYSVINLASYAYEDQLAAASQFTEQVVDVVGAFYDEAAQTALGSRNLDLPDVVAQLAADASLFDLFASEVERLLAAAFQDVLGPVLKQLAEWAQILITGRPDCNGLVLHDYLIFKPYQPEPSLLITKTYEGPQNNPDCGEPPHTFLGMVMTRQLDKIENGPLRHSGRVYQKVGF